MKRLLLALVFVLLACQAKPVCNASYSLVGNECCLDENSNQVCDLDEELPAINFNEMVQEQITTEELNKSESNLNDLPINKVIKMAEDRVQSYAYTTPYTKLDGASYYVKGDLVRADLSDVFSTRPGDYVDTLLFNRSSKTVKGFCKRLEHACRDSTSKTYDLDYKTLWDDTPFDRLLKFKNKEAEMVKWEGEIVEDRVATLLVFKEPAQTTSLWVDAHFGLPLKIRVAERGVERVYVFDHLSVNTVKDDVFTSFNIQPRKGLE